MQVTNLNNSIITGNTSLSRIPFILCCFCVNIYLFLIISLCTIVLAYEKIAIPALGTYDLSVIPKIFVHLSHYQWWFFILTLPIGVILSLRKTNTINTVILYIGVIYITASIWLVWGILFYYLSHATFTIDWYN